MSDEFHILSEVFVPPGEIYSPMSHELEAFFKFLLPNCFHQYFNFVSVKWQEVKRFQQIIAINYILHFRIVLQNSAAWLVYGKSFDCLLMPPPKKISLKYIFPFSLFSDLIKNLVLICLCLMYPYI